MSSRAASELTRPRSRRAPGNAGVMGLEPRRRAAVAARNAPGPMWYKRPVSTAEPMRRAPERSAARVVLTSAITAAIVSVATVFAVGKFAPQLLEGGGGGDEDVEVPLLLGMRPEMAGELLEGRGLRLVVAEERPDANATAGTIASQDPLRSSRVDVGTAVSVVVSTGTPRTAVPAIVGQSLEAARAALEGAGLEVGEVREGGEGDPGSVVGADPEPGAEVAPGTRVELTVVASGVEVPEVVGLTRRRAEEALTKAGLKVGRVRWRYNENRNPFVVLEQTPAAGERAPLETEVELVVNEE